MVANGSVVVRLSDLVDGQEAVCYAALVKKTRGMTKSNQPYVKCLFRDKRVQYEAPLWHDHRYFQEAERLTEGLAYRLELRARHDLARPRHALLRELRAAARIAGAGAADRPEPR